jgi:hypothetical protein
MCGQRFESELPGDVCSACAAGTAIATPEDAAAAKVTPPETAVREGEPPLELPRAPEPWPYKHEPGPASGCGCISYCILGIVAVTGLCLILPFFSRVRGPALRTTTRNHLKQIGLACHEYHDIHKRLPSPRMTVQKDGKEVDVELSWRVAVLPFLDENHLFKRFDDTRGWNDPKNAALRDPMPSVFVCDYRDPPEGTIRTPFQYFTGPDTLFPDNAPRKLGEIPDGTVRTLMVAESDETVIWTRPADMAIAPGQPLPLPQDDFVALFADASTRVIHRNKVSDAVLRQIINPNDNQPAPGWDDR